MSSMTKIAQSDREELRAALQSLEGYEVPQILRPRSVNDSNDSNNTDDNHDEAVAEDATATSTLDPALIKRYKEARDLYLRRQIEFKFLQYLETYDGETIIEDPDLPTEEEEQELKEHLAEVRSQVNEAAQGFHQQILELQEKHNTLVLRREELRNIVQDMEKDGDGNDPDASMMDNDDDQEIDEDALAEEEDRLSMLQKKKAQMQVELNRLRQETSLLKTKAETTEAEVAELLQDTNIKISNNNSTDSSNDGQPLSPTALQAEAEETQKKLEDLKEMQSHYDGMREVLEELTSIQILSITEAPTTSEGGEESHKNDKESEGSPSSRSVRIHVRVLRKHEMEVILQSEADKPGVLRVKAAKILTSTVVTAPVDEYEKDSNSQDENGGKKVLKLTIAPLDDLVRLCAMFPPAEELRFLMREAMARIRITESRVIELAVLYNNVLTKIGAVHQPSDNFGSPEQEVVCSLNEGISIVLRLTADCPIVPGSVYIYNMVGVCGWDDESVKKIKERVSSKEFQSPWALIQEVQKEISSFTLPKTPTLPLRRKFQMEL